MTANPKHKQQIVLEPLENTAIKYCNDFIIMALLFKLHKNQL